MPPKAHAAGQLPNRYDRMSNAEAGVSATHVIGFGLTDVTTPIGSILIEFCANDAIPNTPCAVPAVFDILNSTFASQAGNTGFSIHANSTNNRLILTRFPIAPQAAVNQYQFDNVINPVPQGSHFIRLQTFSSTDATGTPIDEGGIAFAINTGVTIGAEVPPYLKLCVSVTIVGYDCSTANSFLMDLGEFSRNNAKSASAELVVATNAGSGYSVTMWGTTLTSGNNTIPALAAPTGSSPGTSQFGVNVRANSNPSIGVNPNGPGAGTVGGDYNIPNQFKFNNGDTIVSHTGVSDNLKLTMSYLVNISGSQAPGVYATTMTYICLANF
ncbi:MAG: hypothetical protein JWL85_721 [Candidatus Saccharibacteria bacterium]|nr:hypothetical protein [Candidatus Saccharibacteria bacterium]